MLPLYVFEACKELFRNLRGPSIGTQLRQELALPRHVGGALADMAADHLQIGFFLRHVLFRAFREATSPGWFPGKAKSSLYLTKPRGWEYVLMPSSPYARILNQTEERSSMEDTTALAGKPGLAPG